MQYEVYMLFAVIVTGVRGAIKKFRVSHVCHLDCVQCTAPAVYQCFSCWFHVGSCCWLHFLCNNTFWKLHSRSEYAKWAQLSKRTVIKFLVLEGQPAKQVEERWTVIYGKSSPYATIKFCLKDFQRGRETLNRGQPPIRMTMNQYQTGKHWHSMKTAVLLSLSYKKQQAFPMDIHTTYFIANSTSESVRMTQNYRGSTLVALLARYNAHLDNFHGGVVT